MRSSPLSTSGAISSRMLRAPNLGLSPASTLIQVTWDQSPDLERFLGFINAYAKGRFSASLSERVTLASTELLDNAVRYGSLARDFSYRLELHETQISVCVQNTTVRTRIDMLTTQLRRLETTPDQVYASELERSMLSGGRRSMLGLARIRHEAEMQIEVSVNDNDVTVRALCAR
jgi:hypothetical protein